MTRWSFALCAVALGGCPQACELVTGPRYQVEAALVAIQNAPLEGDGEGVHVRFVSDTIEVTGSRAVAYARGEVSGSYHGIETTCICVERVLFARKRGEWKLDAFPLPRLQGVVAQLEAREAALAHGDVDRYLAGVHDDYHDDGVDRARLAERIRITFAGTTRVEHTVVSRVIRLDRHEATVTETFHVQATVDGREIDQEGRARYVLRPQAGGWRFVAGLM